MQSVYSLDVIAKIYSVYQSSMSVFHHHLNIHGCNDYYCDRKQQKEESMWTPDIRDEGLPLERAAFRPPRDQFFPVASSIAFEKSLCHLQKRNTPTDVKGYCGR